MIPPPLHLYDIVNDYKDDLQSSPTLPIHTVSHKPSHEAKNTKHF